jgi:hypothetical protein
MGLAGKAERRTAIVGGASHRLTVEQNVLTVRAERAPVQADSAQMIGAERPSGAFTRQVFLGETLDAGHIVADCTAGVLTLTIPVREAAKPAASRSPAATRSRPSPPGSRRGITGMGAPCSRQPHAARISPSGTRTQELAPGLTSTADITARDHLSRYYERLPAGQRPAVQSAARRRGCQHRGGHNERVPAGVPALAHRESAWPDWPARLVVRVLRGNPRDLARSATRYGGSWPNAHRPSGQIAPRASCHLPPKATAHWCTIRVPAVMRLLMHPRCRRGHLPACLMPWTSVMRSAGPVATRNASAVDRAVCAGERPNNERTVSRRLAVGVARRLADLGARR